MYVSQLREAAVTLAVSAVWGERVSRRTGAAEATVEVLTAESALMIALETFVDVCNRQNDMLLY